MVIDKIFLDQQKAAIELQLKKIEADYNAARGALQLIEFSLTHLAKEVEEKIEGK